QEADYQYDIFGNRLVESVWTSATGWVTTHFAYLDQNAWGDFDATNHLITRRVYLDGVDELFARETSTGSPAFYDLDRLGSVRLIQDISNNILDNLSYDAYGNVLSESNSSYNDRERFAGMEWIAAV